MLRLWGVATDRDLQQSGCDLYDHPSFETLEYLIDEYTDVTKLDISSNGVHLVAELDAEASKRNPSLRVAIVGDEQLLLGLTNMYLITFDLQGGTWVQATFATVDEARAWLAGEERRREEC